MKSKVPQDIVDKLIILGKRDNFDDPSIADDYEKFRPYEYLGRIHWQGWYSVCENLPIEEHIALFKAVVMAMRYSGWDGGSVAAGIWVYRQLEEKISNNHAADVAKWAIDHSDNPWMPFGNQRDRESFLTCKDIDTSENRSGSMLFKIKLNQSSERSRREQAQQELQKQQHLAKDRRVALREKEAEAQLVRKKDHDNKRLQIILIGEQLDVANRLQLLVEHYDLPIHSFPSIWAEVEKEAIKTINKDLREKLIVRLSGFHKGPWKLLREHLEN
jgi:hypothetical protein